MAEMKRVYIVPEYCHGPFYMGWHIYERERLDGVCNSDGEWGWIRRSDLRARAVVRLCIRIGHGGMLAFHSFEDQFARRFPLGLRAEITADGEYWPLPMCLDARPDWEEAPRMGVADRRLFFYPYGGRTIALLADNTEDAMLLLQKAGIPAYPPGMPILHVGAVPDTEEDWR